MKRALFLVLFMAAGQFSFASGYPNFYCHEANGPLKMRTAMFSDGLRLEIIAGAKANYPTEYVGQVGSDFEGAFRDGVRLNYDGQSVVLQSRTDGDYDFVYADEVHRLNCDL